MFHIPLNLSFHNILVEEIVKNLNVLVTSINMTFIFDKISRDTKNYLVEEFGRYNLEIDEILILTRSNRKELAHLHIDVDRDCSPWNVNLLIPVANCNNGELIWADGLYTQTPKYNPYGIPYLQIEWQEEPKIIHRVETLEPCLVKVNTPHGSYSNHDLLRSVATIKFKGNPTFESVSKKLEDFLKL